MVDMDDQVAIEDRIEELDTDDWSPQTVGEIVALVDAYQQMKDPSGEVHEYALQVEQRALRSSAGAHMRARFAALDTGLRASEVKVVTDAVTGRDYLCPEGWEAQSTSPSFAGSVTRTVDVDGEEWEMAILIDRWPGRAWVDEVDNTDTWSVGAYCVTEDSDREVIGQLTYDRLRVGWTFPTGAVEAWVRAQVRAGQTTLI